MGFVVILLLTEFIDGFDLQLLNAAFVGTGTKVQTRRPGMRSFD